VRGTDPSDPEVEALIAASVEDGEWVLIDPDGTTADDIFTHLGYHDPGDYQYVSSGDIVSVQVGAEEFVTYATLKCASGYTEAGCESDFLALIDPETGEADIIGEVGYTRLFGLGFWGNQVYGFNNQGDYLTMDVDTGEGTLVEAYIGTVFWGAGSTTKPHVIVE